MIEFSEAWMRKFKDVTFSAWNSFYKVVPSLWRIHSNDAQLTNISDFLRKELEKEGFYSEKGDKTMRKILTATHKDLTYAGDQANWGMPEHWNTYAETYTSESCDCEDGAIMIYIDAIMAGIDPNRIYLVWGEVVGGGHCFVIYKRDSDGREIPIDWCYFYSNAQIKDMVPYRENPNYFYGRKEWGRCNHLRGFGDRI